MNDRTILSEKEKSIRPGKKIWEIKVEYHCSVIGTCLRRSDLRKLARKKVFKMQPGLSSYQIHSILVNCAATRNPRSRALHKILDTGNRAAVNRYARARSDEEIRELWESDLQSSDVAGAYWAAMTHPVISSGLSFNIYGQIHMMEHDFLGEYQRNQKILEKLRHKMEILENERQSFEDATAELQAVRHDNFLISEENEYLKKQLEQYKVAESESLYPHKLEKMEEQIRVLRCDNSGLRGRIDKLGRDLEEKDGLLDQAGRITDSLEKRNADLQAEKGELQQEVASLEAELFVKMAASCGCSSCDDRDTERCPGPDLCGKTVLYVGGQHNMVPRYKQLVEKYGGRFIHHDGGKEASRARLPKMLGRADAVLCPVNCVSHDACNQVKKICKRCDKPFVMMRSSGLSSLARGLSAIVQ